METKCVTVNVLAIALLSNQVVWDVKRFSGLVLQHVSEERNAFFFSGVFELTKHFYKYINTTHFV